MTDAMSDTNPLHWYQGPAFQLLVVLMSVYLIGTFIGSEGAGAHAINVLLLVSLVLGVRKITRSAKALKITLAIVLAGLVFRGSGWLLTNGEIRVMDYWLNMVLFAAVLIFLILAVVKADRVNADTIFAAAAAFMLLGFVWSFAFMLVHSANPEAFSLSPADQAQPASALIHYSFTTLTTVGYGAISPISDMARTLSDLEALIAQLYLAVVVARLVSLQIEDSRRA